MINDIFFKSAGDERGTPQEFFDTLNAEFGFTLDAAASSLNHKVDTWFGEGGLAFDALEEDWGGDGSIVWLNPPYSACGAFIAKAREEADKGAVVVMLLPVRSDTEYWHTYIYDKKTNNWRPGVNCRFLSGRLSFELHVPEDMRRLIRVELGTFRNQKEMDQIVKVLVEKTGLPKMAIERIYHGMPDEDLLDSAPFPSCVVIFTKA